MKQWYSHSGHVDETTVDTEISSWVVVDTRFNRTVYTTTTFDDATEWFNKQSIAYRRFLEVRGVGESSFIARGQFVVPLFPAPIFDAPGTILTTRGFWDVILDASLGGTRIRTVANFAMGLVVLPVASVYDLVDDQGTPRYQVKDGDLLPDILTDDAGWFVYESFARITETTTPVAFDPPFHSKAKRNFAGGSALAMVVGYDVSGFDDEEPTVSRLTFGCRFRILVEN